MIRKSIPLVAAVAVSVLGCGVQSDTAVTPSAPPTPHAVHDDGHAHPDHGPHGGDLVELGHEAYHAEVVHDDAAATVTVYLLGPDAKTAVPIDAPGLTISLVHDGAAEQFELAAQPQANEPAGQSSRFISTDAELVNDLDYTDNARLSVKISGKPYSGALSHNHAGHAHAE